MSEIEVDEIVGEHPVLRKTLTQLQSVAPTDAPVLIRGEGGTGKELMASAIHRLSARRRESFININHTASELLESELFGHENGLFTGSVSQKTGRLELAGNGTLYLDELGEISVGLQRKLLRVVQDREFERLGRTRTIPINVRLIAATGYDLGQSEAVQRFDSDLLHLLFPIEVPPLRQRRQDIPLLVRYFVQKFGRRMNKRIERISDETMEALMNWNWPGNISELENFVERSVALTEGPVLEAP